MNKYTRLSTDNFRVVKVQLFTDRGYRKSKLYIPIVWLDDMGIYSEDRELSLVYDKKKKEITIKKFEK